MTIDRQSQYYAITCTVITVCQEHRLYNWRTTREADSRSSLIGGYCYDNGTNSVSLFVYATIDHSGCAGNSLSVKSCANKSLIIHVRPASMHRPWIRTRTASALFLNYCTRIRAASVKFGIACNPYSAHSFYKIKCE